MARDLWAEAEAQKAKRAEQWPTEQDAVNTINQCYHRLKDLGWDDPEYCPKDGSALDLIEVGSTGIHRGFYLGEWPGGTWEIPDERGDLWSSRPILARAALEGKGG